MSTDVSFLMKKTIFLTQKVIFLTKRTIFLKQKATFRIRFMLIRKIVPYFQLI